MPILHCKPDFYTAKAHFLIIPLLCIKLGMIISSRETAQSITLTFGESEKELFLVNGKNGQSEKATLENGQYTFELGGGEMQVFYLA